MIGVKMIPLIKKALQDYQKYSLDELEVCIAICVLQEWIYNLKYCPNYVYLISDHDI